MVSLFLPHFALFSQVSVAVQDGRQHPQGGVARLALVVLHAQQPPHHQLYTLDLNRGRAGNS